VRIAALDDFEFENVGAIKIDAEGSELEVLRGARDTLQAHPDTVVILEINRFALDMMGHSEKQVRDELKGQGYRCFYLPVDNTDDGISELADDSTPDTDFVFNLMFKR
jgi:hypothetical protein